MRRRTALAIVLVALVLPAGWAVRGLGIDNRLERWTGGDEAGRAAYQRFRDLFGSDEFVMAVISGKDVLSAATLELGLDAVERIEGLAGVTRVQGPSQLYRDLFGAEDADALVRELTATPFYRDLLVSRDGSATALLIEVAPQARPGSRERIVDGVRSALAPLEERGLTVHLVGSTVLAVALDRASAGEARRAFPLAVVGSLIVLGLLLRSIRATCVAAACAALALVLTFGLIAATGRSLNMVSAALPALLWVLALGNIVHLLRRYRALAVRHDLGDALERALSQTGRGCALAAVTTAAGFGSLVTAPMVPVRELGAFAAAGILISLAVNLCVGPVLIRLLRIGGDPRAADPREPAIERAVLRRPMVVIAATATAAAGALASLPLISVESNPVSFLSADHPVSRDYAAVAGMIGGFYTLEVVLDLPVTWTDPAAIARIETIANDLQLSPVVARVISPVDLLRQLRTWEHDLDPTAYSAPSTQQEADALVDGLDARGQEVLATMVANRGHTVRLSAVVDEMEQHRFLGLVDAARGDLSRLPDGWSGTVTGQVLELVRSQQRLVTTQLESLGIALVLVFLTMRAGLGSWRLTALSVPPNILPLLTAFGLMALLRFPLDPATVMVASVALGIAVDNTAHALEGVRRLERRGHPRPEAVVIAMRRIAPAMLITSATAAVGFLALTSSEFVPIAHFGVLAAAAIATAFAGDTLLLPATLVLGRRS